jgi:hypothetical protein
MKASRANAKTMHSVDELTILIRALCEKMGIEPDSVLVKAKALPAVISKSSTVSISKTPKADRPVRKVKRGEVVADSADE